MIPWVHTRPQPKHHLDSFSHFCTPLPSAHSTLQWATRYSLKIAALHREIRNDVHITHSSSLGTPKSSTQTVSRSFQLFFAGLTTVTDRPTHHATWSVTKGRLYICSTAMQSKNGLYNTGHAIFAGNLSVQLVTRYDQCQ